IYILRTDTGFKYILEDTKDSVMSQSSFNERFPQYSNNNKLRFNAQNFNNLSANDKFNIEDLIGYDVKFIRNLIIIE
ncbi:MAG: hypothetical protein FWF51_13050, partial [Chitinivibrionia bacterium]|nr:hypothetical protein [Chitinivibrionia bacterium]